LNHCNSQVKEGLALLNGTQAMGELAAALHRAERYNPLGRRVRRDVVEALKGTPVAFDERIHAARPHAGQVEVAATCARCLQAARFAPHIWKMIRVSRMLIVCAACHRFTAQCAMRCDMRRAIVEIEAEALPTILSFFRDGRRSLWRKFSWRAARARFRLRCHRHN